MSTSAPLPQFSLLPVDDPQLSPDEQVAASVAGALAPPSSQTPVAEPAPMPFGRSWQFDFEEGQFIRAGGAPADTQGFGALEQWLLMAAKSARYAHAVFCADDETEILTADGWRHHDALAEGDEVLTLDHESGEACWQPVLRLNRFDVVDEPMLSIEGRQHSSLTTLAHRWPVIERRGADRRVERRWHRSVDLTSEHRILTGAPCADVPAEATVSDALVEAVAWFWTEGSIRTARSSQITITQSERANPKNVAAIRSALTGVYGNATTRRMSSGSGALAPPMWREHRSRGLVDFNLNTRASDVLLAIAPHRIVRRDFIRSLTHAQLERFVNTSLRADGWRSQSGTALLAQKDPRRLEAFELALILLGRTPHTYTDKWLYRTRRERYAMTVVSASRKSTFHVPAPCRAKRSTATARVEQRPYSGIVWCPTTPNRTWLARRRGCVYFTGNSDEFGMEDPDSTMGHFAEGELLSDWQQALIEAWMVHDRVTSVENMSLDWDPTTGTLTIIDVDIVTDEDQTVALSDVTLILGGAQ